MIGTPSLDYQMNRRMAKKRNESLATYIYRVLQQVFFFFFLVSLLI